MARRQGHDHRVQPGQHVARVLGGEILVERKRRGGIEIMQHQAIGTVCHDPNQFPGPGENQITTAGIEFPEKTLEEATIQF